MQRLFATLVVAAAVAAVTAVAAVMALLKYLDYMFEQEFQNSLCFGQHRDHDRLWRELQASRQYLLYHSLYFLYIFF